MLHITVSHLSKNEVAPSQQRVNLCVGRSFRSGGFLIVIGDPVNVLRIGKLEDIRLSKRKLYASGLNKKKLEIPVLDRTEIEVKST